MGPGLPQGPMFFMLSMHPVNHPLKQGTTLHLGRVSFPWGVSVENYPLKVNYGWSMQLEFWNEQVAWGLQHRLTNITLFEFQKE